MTPTSQFAQHPDVESLNAFVENALPAVERESVMAHLADCKRCREITYLAQAAAEEDSDAAVPAVQPANTTKPEPRGMLVRWPLGVAGGGRRLVILAGALAALAAFTIVSLPKHPAPPLNRSQEAKVSATPAPESVQAPPRTVEVPSTAQAVDATRSAARPAFPARAGAGRASSSGAAPAPMYSEHQSYGYVSSRKGTTQPAPLPSVASDSTLATVSVTPEPQLQQVGSQQQVGVQQQAEGQQQVRQDIPATYDALQVQPANPVPVPRKPVQPRSAIMAGQGFGKATAGAAPRGSSRAALSAPYKNYGAAGAPQPANAAALYSRAPDVNDSVMADKALETLLPSGAHPVITVAARQRVVALDPSGAIYLSDDVGNLWQPVAQQWTGRAATLRIVPRGSAKKEPGAAGSAISGLNTNAPGPNLAAPKSLFELVNDQGVIWTSEDGNIWKPREQPEPISPR